MNKSRTFTGRTRAKHTHRLVWLGEVLSRGLITVGGIATILAVLMIGVFLIWVVYPLLLPASVRGEERVTPPWTAAPLHLAMDEDQLLAWGIFADGTVQILRLDNGTVIQKRPLFEDGGPALTAFSGPGAEDDVAFGFADGSVRGGTIAWSTETLEGDAVPEALRGLAEGEVAEHEGGLLRRTPGGQFQLLKLDVSLEPPLDDLGSSSPVLRLDHASPQKDERFYCVLSQDGKLRLHDVTRKKAPGPRRFKVEVTTGELPLAPPAGKAPPQFVLLSGQAENVYAAWDDGTLYRFNTRDLEKPLLIEVVDLLEDPKVKLTALRFLIGRTTLLAGDSTGRVRAWFGTRPATPSTADGVLLRAGHDFPGKGGAVSALAASSRTYFMASGHADGQARVRYVTSEKLLADLPTEGGQPVRQLALAPKDDGLAVLTPAGLWHWRMDPGHPEATLRSLFLPVWYEGYEKPQHVWQSSGTDAYEPKLGLWPLVFGTLKATFYSLLVAVPLALLAAIYTSEFLHPRVKGAVKPTIELMASLPSVVLGFLAALVFAPYLDRVLPVFLALFLTVPAALLLGAYLWQLLPDKAALRLARWRFAFILAALVPGVLAAGVVGPAVERLLFAGSVKGWLTGRIGTGASGWLVLLLPVSSIGAAWLLARTVNPQLRGLTASWGRPACALLDLGKFLAVAAVAVALAGLAGLALGALGLDPRGTVFGPYEQRNALVVGFVMGFAVIPIIYTIAEDALSAVPEHLRSASLGCGATRWQTAVRIIIPTAMSGLFSAVMVGLGRAVGETMIVLMAAGNTPVLDLNVFNGFRTLSANIAVEMPEAVRGSTHFRVLYLAGLVLFSLTFVLNTIAEAVRQRFRKRAYQL